MLHLGTGYTLLAVRVLVLQGYLRERRWVEVGVEGSSRKEMLKTW